MASGLALDHAAWSSPWRLRSVRDKGVLSGSLLIAAISLPPFPGGASVAAISAALLLGPIGVGVVRLLRILWLPMASIVIGVATVAVSLSWDGGLNAQITAPGLAMAAALAVRFSRPPWPCSRWPARRRWSTFFAALRKARVPGALVEIAALVYRFTFSLLESVGAIHHAQEARLGYINRKAAMRPRPWGGGAVHPNVGSGPAPGGRPGRPRLRGRVAHPGTGSAAFWSLPAQQCGGRGRCGRDLPAVGYST